MTATKLIEYRISRQLVQRKEKEGGDKQSGCSPWAERLITILAVTSGLVILGSYFEELLWFVLAAATILTFR